MIPSEGVPESTPALLREGYLFVPNPCGRLGLAVFSTRPMPSRAMCMRGEAAAKLFYWGDPFAASARRP